MFFNFRIKEMKRKREAEAKKNEREKRLLERDSEREEQERRKEMKRQAAARELQVVRQQPAMTKHFLFYHTPRQSAEEFLKTTGWLSNRYSPEMLKLENSGLVEALTSTIVGLRAETPVDIDVSRQAMFGFGHLRACFLGVGFPNFVQDLLKRFYPPLRHRLFRNVHLSEDRFKSQRVNRFIFLWGDTRDRSPSVPRLTVTLRISESPQQASITFIANEAWVDDRLSDVRACIGSGHIALAMSQHPRLGRDSPLAKLDRELLLAVVDFLS
jgi:hypothetical protein